jgi:hypothetical protein
MLHTNTDALKAMRPSVTGKDARPLSTHSHPMLVAHTDHWRNVLLVGSYKVSQVALLLF